MPLKVYNLCCANEHPFEGWFGSAGDFDSQQRDGLLSCPVCGSAEVRKTPSAPYVNSGGSREVVSAADKQPTVMPSTAQLQAMFLKMAREIVANTEDVGARFADEARRIHYSEAPERGIRGVASRDEAQSLHDEGITVMQLPFADLLKEPLQ
jgi:hypothetical protein